MIINRDTYIFSKQHGDQLQNMLSDRSVAFSFYSFKSYLMLETAAVKEAGLLTKVTFHKDLLPKHCKLELVERALASLEMFPNNVQLLTTFRDYIENSPSEHAGYSFMNGVTWGLFVVCIIVDVPLALSVAVFALMISNILSDHYLEKKLGIWVGELKEGSHRKPVNFEELEANLIALVDNCKTAENIGEVTYREQRATVNSSVPPVSSAPFSFFPHYPRLEIDPQRLTYGSARDCPSDSLGRGY